MRTSMLHATLKPTVFSVEKTAIPKYIVYIYNVCTCTLYLNNSCTFKLVALTEIFRYFRYEKFVIMFVFRKLFETIQI